MNSSAAKDIILVTDHATVTGGLAQVAIAQAVGLSQQGYTVHYIHGDVASEVDQRLIDAGVKVMSIGKGEYLKRKDRLTSALQGIFDLSTYRKLKRILLSLTDAPVLVHGWSKCLSPSLFLALKSARSQVYVWNHDYFLMCPNGGYYNYQSNRICTLKPGALRCLATHCDSRNYFYKLWRYARHTALVPFRDALLKRAQLVCLGQFNKDIINSAFHALSSEPVIVTNPVRIVDSGRAEAERNTYFLMIGRLSPEKGYVQICRILKSYFPEIDIRVVGGGDESIANELASLGVQVLGWKDAEGVKVLVQHARALIFPSVWYEADGLVVLEAMATGIPVLCSDCCSARALVKDGEHGRHFSFDKPETIVAIFEQFLRDATIKAWSERAYTDYWQQPRSDRSHTLQVVELIGK